jgi:MerR family transcriptional regulator, light-induced transcriptional regulator
MGFSIKELESLSGIKAHTIRIWEQRYKFLKPSRTLTNIRTYTNEELKTLLTVALLNKHGYKISRIDNMRPEQRRQEVLQLNTTEARSEQVVNDLIGTMVDLDFIHFEALLAQQIQQHGLFATISGVVFQFLEKVGILWQTNRIQPAQEHVASCIVRQKLISAIDQLPAPVKRTPFFLLFLPENEHHELGLLFVYYLLKKRGLPVLYLGANVPLKDVSYVVDQKKPAHLYLHLSSFPVKQNFIKYLHTLSERVAPTHILVSGAMIEETRKALPLQVQPLQSLAAVITYIHSV